MRILHFLWGLPNGGAENLAVDLANEQSRDNEVILFVANGRVDETVKSRISPAVRFECLGRPEGSRNPYWLARLVFMLRMLRPDVVHSHSDSLAKLGKFIPAPMVLTVHDINIELGAASSCFAMVCCISEAVFRDVTQRYPSLVSRQVDNGVLIDKIATGNRIQVAGVRAVQISRLVHEKKGQDLLIEALAMLNSEPHQPKLRVDFIGDGPSLKYLVDLATQAGVSESCNFMGATPREKIYQALWEYDLLVQPSRYEGFGLTVAEAMAAGVAVVVSDIEGPMEIIDHGVFGQFFEAGDAQSLAKALRKAMGSLGTREGKMLLDSARRRVLEKYDVRLTSGNYCRIYSEVAGV